KLRHLHCGGTRISNLSPLKGMPLVLLNCSNTRVSDASLADIKDCKDLTELILARTQLSNAGLVHIKSLKNLKRLDLHGTKVSDPSALASMPLDEIRLTPKNMTTRGLRALRNMKTLKSIGTDWNQVWPAAEFWARYDKGEFTK